MRHSLYANNRKMPSGSIASREEPTRGFPKFTSGSNGGDKTSIILDNLRRRALDLYEDDKEDRQEILDRVSMYPVNVSLARAYRDKKTEKQLTNDLINFLDQKIQRKEEENNGNRKKQKSDLHAI